jgi:hypothetical protein
MVKMFRIAVLAMLLVICRAYWREECPELGEFVLPDNKELDCALRHLAVDYTQMVLGDDIHGIRRVGEATNIQICNISFPEKEKPVPPTRDTVIESLGGSSEIFVSSSTGSDEAGDGSEDKPFQTITKAQQLARTKQTGNGTGIVVWLREGTYYQEGTLAFTTEDSGSSAAAPTIYAGYPGENAVVSGGMEINASDLEWEQVTLPGGSVEAGREGAAVVYRAKLPPSTKSAPLEFTGLFWNGSRLTRARYPNCADITGTDCYSLNASGKVMDIESPIHNIQVKTGPYTISNERQQQNKN